MNGPHDLGGKHGLGPINPETEEPVFHHPWEGRMYGLVVAAMTGGVLIVDEQRHAVERMPYSEYYGSSYYERWLFALEKLFDEKGIIPREELERKVAEQKSAECEAHYPAPAKPSALATKVMRVLREGASNNLETGQAPEFQPGDKVITKNLHPKTHLRLPSYAKSKVGVVERHYGAFGHPGARAHGRGNEPAHLYSVRFEAGELWGPDAEDPRDFVYLDLFESYLKPAEEKGARKRHGCPSRA